ncbi:MAG TPA: hypothetical protein VFO55_07740 [Gemmatimonadaceae bacterium]|nr:hypothetical protein [Gemmatimonadaceae bacterium]
MTKNPKEERTPDEAGSSDYKASPDQHIDRATGTRVPTPDPKDQTGDPDEANPAMRELHERQARRDATEG